MDVALTSMVLSQSQVQQQASLSIMKKVMDQAEGNAVFINKMLGETNIKALQHAAEPHLGSNIDMKV
jgi:hypothetical protein